MEFLKITNNPESCFQIIAHKLLNEYAVETYDSLYRITEIEFYWNSQLHVDKSTYPRIHVDPKGGTWFFHYSGVDIALRDEINGGYGGILIRGIYDIKNNRFFKGPMVCAMRLFSGSPAFNEPIQTKIISYSFDKSELINGERIGLGKNAQENDAYKLKYRYSIDLPVFTQIK